MTIALLTDFGLRDAYVGVMKAVILRIHPSAHIIDVTHEIASHTILEAAVVLKENFSFFPRGTIFIAVVDPGVGSQRLAILVRTRNYFFIGPDNGVVSLAAHADGIREIVNLTAKQYFLSPVSSTFQGRDIFAPIAGYLSKGALLHTFGKRMASINDCVLPQVSLQRKVMEARILYADKFGNLVTNIDAAFFERLTKGKKFIARLNRKVIKDFYTYYAQAKENVPFFIKGSLSYLEISLKNSSAAEYFRYCRDARHIIKIKFS